MAGKLLSAGQLIGPLLKEPLSSTIKSHKSVDNTKTLVKRGGRFSKLDVEASDESVSMYHIHTKILTNHQSIGLYQYRLESVKSNLNEDLTTSCYVNH